MIYIQHIQDLVGYMQVQMALEHKSKRQATVIKHTRTHQKNSFSQTLAIPCHLESLITQRRQMQFTLEIL